MMHVLDYDRALGELLELDDTIRATIACASQLILDRLSLIFYSDRLEGSR